MATQRPFYPTQNPFYLKSDGKDHPIVRGSYGLATFRRKIDGITSLYSWRMWRVIGKSVRTPAGQRSTCEAA